MLLDARLARAGGRRRRQPPEARRRARAAVDRARRARHAGAHGLGRARRHRADQGGRDDLRLRRRGRRRQRGSADREAEGPPRDRQRGLAREGRLAALARRRGVQLPRDAGEGGARRRHRRVLRQRRRRAAGGRAERAPSVRARDRLRRDLALQRRAPRARPAQPLLRRHEAAAHRGLHRQRITPTGSRRSSPRWGRGSPTGSCSTARPSLDGIENVPAAVRRSVPRRQHRQDARARRTRTQRCTNSMCVEPRRLWPSISKWQTRGDGDGGTKIVPFQ